MKHLSPGQHPVGFLSIARYDKSRPAIKEQAEKNEGRLLQINIWYPAVSAGKNSIKFADYIKLIGKEINPNPYDVGWEEKAIETYSGWPVSAGVDKQRLSNLLTSDKLKMLASRDAQFGGKTFPLIMLVHGFAADYAWLAEFLASFGYIILQVPTKGTDLAELDYETKGLETQVLDYEFALKVLEKEYSFNSEYWGTLGFSFGGQSAMALGIRNEKIRAIVSFDGGIGSAFGAQLLNGQSFYDSKKNQAPLLHMYNPRDQYTDLSWLKSIQSIQRYLVAMKNVEHGHFTSFGLLNNSLPGIMGNTAPDPGDAYETMMLLSKKFFDKELKREKQQSGDFLESAYETHPWARKCVVQSEMLGPARS